jgi:hypothetical protein
MPDIGYYTLPVIPSFRGIESATQDQLDSAFRDSGRRAGQAYADEHEKAFRQKKVDASRNPDTTTVEADRRRGTASGQAEAEAHNEAFNKTRADDPAAVDTATKVGTEQGKASGKAAGDAHNEEVKKTTGAQADSIGRSIGEALGNAAGNAAADMIEDMLPKALRGLGLQGIGRELGESLGGAIGEHAADVPDALIKGWDTAADTIKRGTDTVKDALGGIKSAAGDTHISLGGVGDGLRDVLSGVRDADVGGGLHAALDGIKSAAGGLKDGLGGAVESLRHLSAGDVTTGLGRAADLIERMEPVASAFGADVSSWPADIRGVIDPISQVSETFGTVKDAISGTAEGLGALVEGSPAAEAAFAGLASAAGPLAALALAIGGAAAGIHQIIQDTDPRNGFVRPQGQAPVQTPAAQMALPGQQQPVQLPPSVRPGQQYTATPGSLDPFAALQPAGTPALTPQQQQPRLVLPPSPIGIDVPDHHEAGGAISGPGPRGKDSVLMWGAPGEHVWTADEVEKVGGHGVMHALRAAVRGFEGGGAVGDDWDAIAQKESGGNWAINTGNGYYGGLQFDLSTWHDFGGDQFAPRPDMTSRENQIAVANRVPQEQRARRWPNTYTAGAGRGGGMQGVGGGDYGAAMGHPTAPPPNENAVRSWVQQNFGIPNTFGTGSWENSAHDADGMWHHNLTHDKSQPGYAFDFHGTPQQMDALANWVADNYKDKTLELIHQGPGFDHNREIKNARFGDVYGAGVNSAHADHVHWAMTAPPGPAGLGGSAAGGTDPRDLPRGRKGDPLYVTSADGGAGGGSGIAGHTAGGTRQSAFDKAGGIGGLAGIGKQALSDTFGFGTILPGLDDFPPTQFLFGMLDSLLGIGGGGSGLGGSLGNMFGAAVNPGGNALGMIPGIAGSTTSPTPGGDSPPAFDPALPGLSAGLGSAPQGESHNIDQSMHVTVNGRSDDDMLAKLGRVMAHPPRAMTNAPQGG